ncbi:hypothetical protein LAWASA_3489 [Lawsonibacter asaccharolyticus]|nr:hypothetical protein LAWASA_3489 [Lawsonibacter asaccharolyticus]
MDRLLVQLEPCTGPCRGLSCCNCFGEAPALHRIGGGRWFDRWAPQCCHSTRLGAREKCMYLQGKTREEWMEEDWT